MSVVVDVAPFIELRVTLGMPASRRRRGSGSARSSNRVVSPQLPKGMYLDAASSSVTGSKSTSRSALPRGRRTDANMGSLADHGSLLQGTSCATYRGVGHLEDCDIYYPYFESEAEALLGSDTKAGRAAALSLMDPLLPSGHYISQQFSASVNPGVDADFAGYSNTESHETAYISATQRRLEQETRMMLLALAFPSTSSCNDVDWSEVESNSSSFGEITEYPKPIVDLPAWLHDPPKMRIYKCSHPGCDFESRSDKGLSTSIFPCPKCGAVFCRSKALNGHIKVHGIPNNKRRQRIQKHTCVHCDKKFVHKRSLEVHEAKKHAYSHIFTQSMSTY
ncbi:uncharacterized protein EV420DRAFT_1573804 [Desarmillaria tabescens]|uniref:C2H2-type domain-containing protein n=1 Tax=Armillaria tabescens TaxID=1929756 RepID=A0AA39MRP6_ARMTA|nr:uncharacterized protein EV420DRAFT_1573804 [Desarmillaria tabescens]KAK0444601.1 hypothetical protein EV420DRAFT_1573804 [Desarmillaria tabescens]